MYCIRCGKEIPEGTEFCYHCGEKILLHSNKKAINKKRAWIWIAVIGLLAAMTAGGYLLITSNDGTVPYVVTVQGNTPHNEEQNQVNEIDAPTEWTEEIPTGEISVEEVPVETTEPKDVQNNTQNEEVKTVILDQNDIYIEYRGIYEHSTESWIVNLYVENKRSSEIYLSLRNVLINRFLVGLSNNGETIPADSIYLSGPNFDFIIQMDDLEEYGIATIDNMNFDLYISAGFLEDEICEVPVNLTVNKNIPNATARNIEKQNMIVLLDEADVFVGFNGIYEYSTDTWIVGLYVETIEIPKYIYL